MRMFFIGNMAFHVMEGSKIPDMASSNIADMAGKKRDEVETHKGKNKSNKTKMREE